MICGWNEVCTGHIGVSEIGEFGVEGLLTLLCYY